MPAAGFAAGPNCYLLLIPSQGIEFIAAGGAFDPLDVAVSSTAARDKAEYHQNHQRGGKQPLQIFTSFHEAFPRLCEQTGSLTSAIKTRRHEKLPADSNLF